MLKSIDRIKLICNRCRNTLSDTMDVLEDLYTIWCFEKQFNKKQKHQR